MSVEELWKRYHDVCAEAKNNGRYEIVEPIAWKHLQNELDKLKVKAA